MLGVDDIRLSSPGGIGAAQLPFHIAGPADDLQAAINSAAGDGRPLWLRPGVYTISATLTIPVAPVEILSCGHDVIIRCHTTFPLNGVMFQIAAGNTGFMLRDIFIDGFDGAINRPDVFFEFLGAAANFQLINITTQNLRADFLDRTIHKALGSVITGVLIDRCALSGGLYLPSSSGHIRDSYINVGDIQGGIDLTNSSVFYCARNHYDNHARLGLDYQVAVGGANAIFHDHGSRYDLGNNGILISGGYAAIEGCHIVQSDIGINIGGGAARIVGNYIETVDAAIHEALRASSSFQAMNNYLAGDVNLIVGSPVFIGNVIDPGWGTRAIDIQGDGGVINGNTILASVAGDAIRLQAGANDNVVQGNVLLGFTITDNGARNILMGNRSN